MKSDFNYFEDFHIGQEGKAERPITARTVTNADICNFAWTVADYNPDHLNQQHMLQSPDGKRVAHGLLGVCLVTGFLSLNSPQQLGRNIPGAYFYSFEVNYRDAIRMDDTISLNWQVAETSDAPEHQGYGRVKTAFQLLNQDARPIYDGAVVTLVRKKSAPDARLDLKPGTPWEPIPDFVPEPGKTYCVEDFPVGAGGETEGRTVTEADIVNFAGLTGDWDPAYVDADSAARGLFGQRIAHGMLVYSAAQGQWTRHYKKIPAAESALAGRAGDKGTFLRPVMLGDTIRCRYRTAATRVSRSKPEMGLVTIESQVVNQRNEVVVEMTGIEVLASRAGAQKSGKI